jgi:flagellar basal body rod protein FlgF
MFHVATDSQVKMMTNKLHKQVMKNLVNLEEFISFSQLFEMNMPYLLEASNSSYLLKFCLLA